MRSSMGLRSTRGHTRPQTEITCSKNLETYELSLTIIIINNFNIRTVATYSLKPYRLLPCSFSKHGDETGWQT